MGQKEGHILRASMKRMVCKECTQNTCNYYNTRAQICNYLSVTIKFMILL